MEVTFPKRRKLIKKLIKKHATTRTRKLIRRKNHATTRRKKHARRNVNKIILYK
jgi:hypothetical protein